MSVPYQRIRRRLRSILARECGNVAIIFAIALPTLVLVTGIVIDYARASAAKATLQAATDAASLAAVTETGLSESQLKALAISVVNINTASAGLGAIKTDVKRSTGADPSVTISASTTVATTLSRMTGRSSIEVAAASTARGSLNNTVLYAAIDMSGSMGLAADPAARAALEVLTKPYFNYEYTHGCMLACHTRDGWEPHGKTVYQMAKENNIPLREDVLNQQFGTLVDIFLDPTDLNVISGRRQMRLYGFSDTARLLQDDTSSRDKIKKALTTYPNNAHNSTLFAALFDKIRSDLGKQGDGSQGNPKKTFLLVTDGVGWRRNAYDPAADRELDPALCDTLKALGFTVAVIEVKYRDATGEYWYDVTVRYFYDKVSPALAQCASPGFYFQASDSDTASLAKAVTDAANAMRYTTRITR